MIQWISGLVLKYNKCKRCTKKKKSYWCQKLLNASFFHCWDSLLGEKKKKLYNYKFLELCIIHLLVQRATWMYRKRRRRKKYSAFSKLVARGTTSSVNENIHEAKLGDFTVYLLKTTQLTVPKTLWSSSNQSSKTNQVHTGSSHGFQWRPSSHISSGSQEPWASEEHHCVHSSATQNHTEIKIPGFFNPTKGIRHRELEKGCRVGWGAVQWGAVWWGH